MWWCAIAIRSNLRHVLGTASESGNLIAIQEQARDIGPTGASLTMRLHAQTQDRRAFGLLDILVPDGGALLCGKQRNQGGCCDFDLVQCFFELGVWWRGPEILAGLGGHGLHQLSA